MVGGCRGENRAADGHDLTSRYLQEMGGREREAGCPGRRVRQQPTEGLSNGLDYSLETGVSWVELQGAGAGRVPL